MKSLLPHAHGLGARQRDGRGSRAAHTPAASQASGLRLAARTPVHPRAGAVGNASPYAQGRGWRVRRGSPPRQPLPPRPRPPDRTGLTSLGAVRGRPDLRSPWALWAA